MFCSQCGTKNDDNAKFCSSCGTAIAAAVPSPTQNQATPNVTSSNTTESATASAPPAGNSFSLENFLETRPKSALLILAMVIAGIGGHLYYNVFKKDSSLFSLSSISQKDRDGAETIPVAKIVYEYRRNELRTLEKYRDKTFNLIGVLYETEKDGGGYRLVVGEGWDTSNYIFVAVPEKYKGKLLEINKGTLVSVTCNGFGKYGTSPYYKNCGFLEKVNTDGVRPEIFLDKLNFEHNELLNPKKKSEVAPSAAQAAAAPGAEGIPVAAQIEKQKKLFVARACPAEEKAESEELTTQHADVVANSGEKYAFVHISCGRSAHALVVIYNGKTIARGREFLNILGGDGKYTAETGTLSYSAPFVAEGDARCCPSGVGAVVLDVQKLEMVFRKIKPQGGEERIPSRDVVRP